MESKNLSYDLNDILRFFSLSKNLSKKLHLNITLNNANTKKPFELALQTLQLLTLQIKSLTFILEVNNDFIEEIIIEEFPYFFLDYLHDLENIKILVPHDNFGLLPSIFEIFKSIKTLTNLTLGFVKTHYSHLPYQQFITIPLIDEFMENFFYLKSLQMNIYFLGSLKEIHSRLTHLILEVTHTQLQIDMISKIKNFPSLIYLELRLIDDSSNIDFYSYRIITELKEALQSLAFLTDLQIIQVNVEMIFDNKRIEGLRLFMRELIERPYLIEFKAEIFDQINLIKFDNKNIYLVKKLYSLLQNNIILKRERILSIIHAFHTSKLRRTFKRPQILTEILNYLI